MPEKKGKTKGKDKEKNEGARKEDQADDISTHDVRKHEKEVEPQDKSEGRSHEHILLKRRGDKEDGDDELEDDGDAGSSDEEEVFEGFSDSEAEERAFSRYDNLLGGSSDEEDSDDEGIEGRDSDDLLDSRSKSIRRVSVADDISVSSLGESDREAPLSPSSSEAESLPRPSKIAKTKRAKAEPIKTGNSAFLPTLMGGYISGSESASDVDVAPSLKKNRRGQRARQAIWEKKYGEKAKHKLQPPKDSRDQGWDMQRGAVDPNDGAARPWKKGIRNPFEKSAVHPERMRHIEKGGHRQDPSSHNQDSGGWEKKPALAPTPKPPRPEPTRDDTGHLHPSWAAAKKAKEEGQKVAFQGRKVVFD